MDPRTVESVRLDVWLDVSCLFKTRSEAKKACTAGRVAVNGVESKPHRLVHAGDRIEIARPLGRRQTVVVLGVAEHSIPRTDARALYDDQSPRPTPEEREIRRMERLFQAMNASAGSPDKRDRRALRKLRGR